MHDGGKKAVVAALLANGGIATAKFVAFGLTGAASMLAEAIHSVADTGNQGLLLLGGKKAKKAPDEQHPFGYGRERYFWAFVVAIVLFSIGSVFALFEGIEKFRHAGHELERVEVAIAVLLVSIVLEALSFRTAFLESRKVKPPEQGWWQFIRRTKSPELAVVLLEDTGALLGLMIALFGISMAHVTHDSRWDALGSIAIGLLLGFIAITLAREIKSFLIGEAADEAEIAKITAAIAESPQVTRLIHLRTLHLGPEELLVAAKMEFDPSLDQASVAIAIDTTEKLIRNSVPEANLIFIEPDTFRPDE